jgi:hypothetical protein
MDQENIHRIPHSEVASPCIVYRSPLQSGVENWLDHRADPMRPLDMAAPSLRDSIVLDSAGKCHTVGALSFASQDMRVDRPLSWSAVVVAWRPKQKLRFQAALSILVPVHGSASR